MNIKLTKNQLTPPVGIFNRRIVDKSKLACAVAFAIMPNVILAADKTVDGNSYSPSLEEVDTVKANVAYNSTAGNAYDDINISSINQSYENPTQGHDSSYGFVGFLQKDQKVTINGSVLVSDIDIKNKDTNKNSKIFSSGIYINGGALSSTAANGVLEVKNFTQNIEYPFSASRDNSDPSRVYGINLSEVELSGIGSIIAQNITSNSVRGTKANENDRGILSGISLNNVVSENKFNLKAEDIINNFSETNGNKFKETAKVYGIKIEGNKSKFDIGEISVNNIKSSMGAVDGLYLQDLDSNQTQIDAINISNIEITGRQASISDDSSVVGLNIANAATPGNGITQVKVNNDITISNINSKSGYFELVAGIKLGEFEADDESKSGTANLIAHDIKISSIQGIYSTSDQGTFAGIYAAGKNENSFIKANKIEISNIKSQSSSIGTDSASGIILDNTALAAEELIDIDSINGDRYGFGIRMINDSAINTKSIDITNVSGNRAYGILLNDDEGNKHDIELTTDSLNISGINGNAGSYGIANEALGQGGDSGKGTITVNNSTDIDVDNGTAIDVSSTKINLNGTYANLSGDIVLSKMDKADSGSELRIKAVQADITGSIRLSRSSHFIVENNSQMRSQAAPLTITNLRRENTDYLPNGIEYPGHPMIYWDWSNTRYLDALTVGEGGVIPNIPGIDLDNEVLCLVDIDRSAIISVQSDEKYLANAKDNAEITFGAAIRVNADGRVLLDNADSDYKILGDIIAGSGISIYDEDDVNDIIQAGHDLHGGEVFLGGRKLTIVGDIFAGNGGKIDVEMNGDSKFEGQVDDYHELNNIKSGQVFHNSAFLGYEKQYETPVYTAGNVSITMNDEATWTARGQSFLSSLSFGDNFSGLVDLSKDEASSITVANLSGNGRFKLHLNSSDVTKSDMLYVTDSLSGNHEIIIGGYVNVNEISEDNPLRFATVKASSAAAFKARSTDSGFFNNEYIIAKETFSASDKDNAAYNGGNGDGKGEYKPGNNMVEAVFDENDSNIIITGVAKRTESDAGRTVINMSRANYANAVYMDTLNKRMGEARYAMGQDNGIWVRMRHDNIGKDDSFRTHNTMFEVGYERKDVNSYGEFHTGVALDYMNGSIDYHSVNGDGDLQRYGLWFYNTFLGYNGFYTDVVLKYGHLKNDFDITSELGEQISGDYSNDVASLSAETGWKFTHNTGFYIEPQLQLQYSYVTSADYSTSQSTQVELDSIHSLIGRAGFRAGKDFNTETPITAYIRGDVLHEFLGDQDIRAYDNTGVFDSTYENDDTWYSAGIGLSVQSSENTYFFIEGEQVFGADNDSTYTVSGGFNHSF